MIMSMFRKDLCRLVVVGLACDPNTWEMEEEQSLSSRLSLAIYLESSKPA